MRLISTLLTSIALSANGAVADSASSSTQSIHFDELPRLVKVRNKHVESAHLLAASSEAREGHLTRSFLPRIAAHAGAETFRVERRNFPTQSYAGIEARMNLFRGFRDSLEEKQRRAESEYAQAQTAGSEAEELLKARKAYWEILVQQEMAQVLDAAITENEKHLQAANQRVRAGIATGTDLLEFRLNAIQLKQDMASFTLALTASERTLKVLLGIPADSRITLGDKVIPHVHEDPLREASFSPNQHWSMLELDARENHTELSRRMASRWWVPSLDLYAGYELQTYRQEDEMDPLDRREAVAGLRLSLALFDGLEGFTEQKSLALRTESVRAKIAQSASELAAEVEQTRSNLRILHELLLEAEKAAPIANEYLAKTLVEYKRGAKNSPDVLGAVQRGLALKRSIIELRKDYQILRAELMMAMQR